MTTEIRIGPTLDSTAFKAGLESVRRSIECRLRRKHYWFSWRIDARWRYCKICKQWQYAADIPYPYRAHIPGLVIVTQEWCNVSSPVWED